MKVVELKKRSRYEDRAILKQVCEDHSAEGIRIGTMRTLLKVLDKLEVSDETLLLEDEEHTTVKRQLDARQFAVAHKDLVDFYDDFVAAKAPI